MKKLMASALLLICVLLTSCDIFMTYEKPDLYLITAGLSYHDENCRGNALMNTQNDADAVEELFTGLADQAGMNWYSIKYRDVYPSLSKEQLNGGNYGPGVARFTLQSSQQQSIIAQEDRDLRQLASHDFASHEIEMCLIDMMRNPAIKEPDEDDIIVFYYAGHGLQETGNLWIVPSIFPMPANNGGEVENAVYSLSDLMASDGLLRGFDGHKVLLLDSCFSGNAINNGRENINGGIGGNGGGGGNSHDNPYYQDDWFMKKTDKIEERDVITGGGSDNFVPDDSGEGGTYPEEGSSLYHYDLIPDIFILTSAGSNQRANDAVEFGAAHSPFVCGLIDSIHPGWDNGEYVHTDRKRIFLSDLYFATKKVCKQVEKQDPQTLLSRYDITIFDLAR